MPPMDIELQSHYNGMKKTRYKFPWMISDLVSFSAALKISVKFPLKTYFITFMITVNKFFHFLACCKKNFEGTVKESTRNFPSML